MDAKTNDKKIAAFARFLIQNVPGDLTDEIMQGWMDNPSAMKRFLAGLVSPKNDSHIVQSRFSSVIATTPLGKATGKSTKDCFTDSSRYLR